MRFNEFFIEQGISPKPLPGYKGFKVANKIIWAPPNMNPDDMSAAIEADPTILDKAQPDLTTTKTTASVPTNLQNPMTQAKTSAERYLGRPLAGYEWDSLLRVANAEASHQPDEQAWVMAAVLNSVRKNNNTVYHEISKPNRMQSVTGTEKDPSASPNFSKAVNTPGLSQILSAAISTLPKVPKNIVHFTSNKEAAYKAGTNKGWLGKLLSILQGTKLRVNPPNIFATQVGDSVFSTDFTPEQLVDIRTKIATKTAPPTKTPSPVAKAPVAKAPVTKTPVKQVVPPKVGKKV